MSSALQFFLLMFYISVVTSNVFIAKSQINDRRERHRRATEPKEPYDTVGSIDMISFSVNSKITIRFTETVVTTEMKNTYDKDVTVAFKVSFLSS